MQVVLVLLNLIWLSPTLSWAEGPKSCLPDFMSLQELLIVGGEELAPQTFVLKSENHRGRFPTHARLKLASDPLHKNRLMASVSFAPEFDGVSLPYNLYVLAFVLDGEMVGWWDYTRGCTGPGLSFFPGAEIRLPHVNLVGDRPQKLQIMVWGRL